jgi:hypothetical protein
MEAKHKLANPASFILAGNATFTLRSVKTGTRFTYRVRHNEASGKFPESWFVKYLNGPDNENAYSYMGMIRKGVFTLTQKSKLAGLTVDTPVVKAFDWSFSRIVKGLDTPNLEVWHAGKCGRCGRKLTVPESIEMGIGPECAKHFGAVQSSLPLTVSSVPAKKVFFAAAMDATKCPHGLVEEECDKCWGDQFGKYEAEQEAAAYANKMSYQLEVEGFDEGDGSVDHQSFL